MNKSIIFYILVLLLSTHANITGTLTLILLFRTTHTFANSVDPDQMASEEAIWSGSALFVIQFERKHYMM